MAEPQIETRLRALFEQQAAAELPATGVDAIRARRAGRVQLHRRRAGTSALALLAAAVVALAVTVAARPGPHRPAPAAPDGLPAVAPKHFNPLTVYPSFSWLPGGVSSGVAETGRNVMSVTAGPHGLDRWELFVFSAGRCHLHITGRTSQILLCLGLPIDSPFSIKIGAAPPVRGHQSVWGTSFLAWRYARGGWAALMSPAGSGWTRTDRARMLKIAGGVRYGLDRAPGRFAVQLDRPSAGWQVGSVVYYPGAFSLPAGGVVPPGVTRLGAVDEVGRPEANVFAGSGQLPIGSPVIDAFPGATGASCKRSRGSTTRVVNGDRVVLRTAVGTGSDGLPVHDLCAVVRGLQVEVRIAGRHPVPGVVSVFEHLRLLGTDPAHWTTRPLG